MVVVEVGKEAVANKVVMGVMVVMVVLQHMGMEIGTPMVITMIIMDMVEAMASHKLKGEEEEVVLMGVADMHHTRGM